MGLLYRQDYGTQLNPNQVFIGAQKDPTVGSGSTDPTGSNGLTGANAIDNPVDRMTYNFEHSGNTLDGPYQGYSQVTDPNQSWWTNFKFNNPTEDWQNNFNSIQDPVARMQWLLNSGGDKAKGGTSGALALMAKQGMTPQQIMQLRQGFENSGSDAQPYLSSLGINNGDTFGQHGVQQWGNKLWSVNADGSKQLIQDFGNGAHATDAAANGSSAAVKDAFQQNNPYTNMLNSVSQFNTSAVPPPSPPPPVPIQAANVGTNSAAGGTNLATNMPNLGLPTGAGNPYSTNYRTPVRPARRSAGSYFNAIPQ